MKNETLFRLKSLFVEFAQSTRRGFLCLFSHALPRLALLLFCLSQAEVEAAGEGQLLQLLDQLGVELKAEPSYSERVVSLEAPTPEGRLHEWLKGVNHILIFDGEKRLKKLVILEVPETPSKPAGRSAGASSPEARMILKTLLARIFEDGTGVRVSSGFGQRPDPLSGVKRKHKGIDLAVPAGTPVLAPWSARVVQLGTTPGLGRFAVLRHRDGVETLYAHLSGLRDGLRRGMEIEAGEVFAWVGRSGRTTGAHLHFELHRSGRPQDPLAASFWSELAENSPVDWLSGRSDLQEATIRP